MAKVYNGLLAELQQLILTFELGERNVASPQGEAKTKQLINAGESSLVARLAYYPKIAGSNPIHSYPCSLDSLGWFLAGMAQ